MPEATERPWPSDPVATSTNGILGTGCPSIIESFKRRDINCYSVSVFALYNAEYKMGAACPFDNTRRSFRKCLVLLGWNLRPASLKKRTENTSAMDAHDVGWPLLVTCTELIESMRSQLAMS